MRWLSTITIIGILGASCSSGDNYEKEIETIEQLEAKVEKARETMLSVDSARVLEVKNSFNKNVERIKKYYVPDTVDQKVANLMNNYKGIKSGVKGYYNEKSQIWNEIAFTRKNLAALKEKLELQDFDDKGFDADKIPDYLKQESNAVNNLSIRSKGASQSAKSAIELHDSLNPKIKEFVQSLDTAKVNV